MNKENNYIVYEDTVDGIRTQLCILPTEIYNKTFKSKKEKRK